VRPETAAVREVVLGIAEHGHHKRGFGALSGAGKEPLQLDAAFDLVG
jgi:hypothetical protein